MSTHTADELDAEEWKRRYAARIMSQAGFNERAAMHAAKEGWELMEVEQLTKYATDPEGAADCEMSYWEDDGDE